MMVVSFIFTPNFNFLIPFLRLCNLSMHVFILLTCFVFSQIVRLDTTNGMTVSVAWPEGSPFLPILVTFKELIWLERFLLWHYLDRSEQTSHGVNSRFRLVRSERCFGTIQQWTRNVAQIWWGVEDDDERSALGGPSRLNRGRAGPEFPFFPGYW